MAIQYPGGTIVNTTFTGATKTNIVNNLNTELKNAGWTAISGDGTGDVILESATTPTANNNIRVRLRDSNLTNCACLNMQNAAATKVSQNFFLLPEAAKTFRVLANKYQFFCFTPGTSAAREFFGMGVPYLPSFLHGVITGEFGWAHGNATTDTDTVVRQSLRTLLHGIASTGAAVYSSGLINGSLMDTGTASGTQAAGGLRLITQQGAYVASANGYRWHDDSLQLVDPLIGWGAASATADEAKIRGQLWGAMIVTDAFTVDTTLSSVDGHDWHGITSSNSGSATDARGTLFMATN